MIAIFKKEFKSYFINMSGYVFIAFILLFAGIFVTAVNLKSAYASFSYALSNMSLVFLFVVPILTMRSLAEERHARTDQLLYSLPLKVTDIVLGKYFAMLAVFALPTLVMGLYPILLTAFGTVPFATSYGALLAFFLLGGALIAICMFMSSLAESQIISAVLSFGVLLAAYLMNGIAALVPATAMASFLCLLALSVVLALIVWLLTKNYFIAVVALALCGFPLSIAYFLNASAFEGLFAELISTLSIFDRFNTFVYGMFDITAIVYYLSIIVFFVFLSVQSVEKRRWS
ncbi:MAG: ABC transporter permease [Clostridia bacterium]|nr:ABC transporter permease [Clostridia bacterium]